MKKPASATLRLGKPAALPFSESALQAQLCEFLDRSLGFVQAVRSAVRTAGTTDLRALTDEVNDVVGPFPSFTHELAASVRAHLAHD